MAGTDEVSDPNAASSDAVDAGGYIPEAPMHTSTQDLIDFQRKQRLEVLRHTIKQVDRNGAPRYRSATDYFDVFTAEPWAAVQPTSPPRPRPQIAQIRTPSPRPVSDHLPRPFLVHTPPLNAARLRSSPRTPHTHHRIDTKRVHDVLDKIRGADRIAEVRRGLGPPASNVAPASVPPQAPPPAPVAAPVAAQVSTTTSAETLDPSPVFHELPPSTPQSITKTVNDSRTIYSSPYLRTPQNKQMGIVSAPATLRRPKRRLSEASEPPPKRNAPETPWHLDDSPSLVYGAPVTPPQWTRIQWQYLSVLANLIPELDQGSLEDVKTFIDTSLPQWLVKEFHPFREELPSRLMALVKWNRTAKPGASDNLALTREVWDQGDSAKDVCERACRVFRAENKVTLENADDYAQKLVSVAELVKRSMAPAKLHQYNKLEVARQVYAPQDEFQLDKQKIQYRVPKLTICISSTPLDLGSDWTGQ